MKTLGRGGAAMVATALLMPAAAGAQTSPTPPAQAPAVADQWHVLPLGLLYDSYLAGEKEPRLSWSILEEGPRGRVWETGVGLRVGLLRRGTSAAVDAEGWQVDLEGAAQLRLAPEDGNALESVDFRGGLWLTRRRGPLAVKAGYYHLSAHLGDEFLLKYPDVVRIDYVRDSIVGGVMYDVTPALQTYAEAGYAFVGHGGAEPIEIQVGAQFTGTRYPGRRGTPVAAVNLHLREELKFRSSLNAILAWGWHSPETGHQVRAGVHGFTGRSMQYSSFSRSDRLIGVGVWFDY